MGVVVFWAHLVGRVEVVVGKEECTVVLRIGGFQELVAEPWVLTGHLAIQIISVQPRPRTY